MQQTTPLQAIISALTPLLVFHDSAMILFCGGFCSAGDYFLLQLGATLVGLWITVALLLPPWPRGSTGAWLSHRRQGCGG